MTDEARGVFAVDRLPLAERYADLLASAGVERGLIGPRETARLWERHLVNCAVLADLVPEAATVCDVGSGAGLPGIVLAVARPDVTVTLLEPLLRRTRFLEEVVSELGLGSVEVIRGRADSLHGVRTFEVVTSRAVAPLPRLLDWSMPLVAPGGALVALKGASVSDEVDAARSDLLDWGCAAPEIHELGVGRVSSPAHALRVTWLDPSSVSSTSTPARRSARRPERGRSNPRGRGRR